MSNYAVMPLSDYDAICNHLRKIANTTSDIKSGEICGLIPTRTGGSISDGIVIKRRDENGRPTAVDVYGTELQYYMFGRAGADYPYPWAALEAVSFVNNSDITVLPKGLFRRNTTLRGEYSFPNVASCDGGIGSGLEGTFQETLISKLSIGKLETIPNLFCRGCSALTEVYLPYAKTVTNGGYSAFGSCTALETIQLGSIGHALEEIDRYAFDGTTQSGLTVTAYCKGAYADSALSRIRNSATNATVIIKASEDTTYNGVIYLAGEALITSIV